MSIGKKFFLFRIRLTQVPPGFYCAGNMCSWTNPVCWRKPLVSPLERQRLNSIFYGRQKRRVPYAAAVCSRYDSSRYFFPIPIYPNSIDAQIGRPFHIAAYGITNMHYLFWTEIGFFQSHFKYFRPGFIRLGSFACKYLNRPQTVITDCRQTIVGIYVRHYIIWNITYCQ